MKTIKLFFACLFLPVFCFSWNGSGHMTGGAVAYYYLQKHNPAVLQKVLATLKNHPWYATRWQDSLAVFTGEEKDVALFMLASTFPDDARKDSVYGGPLRAKWHYINYPFVPEGQVCKLPPIPSPNVEERLAQLLVSVKGQEESAAKAIDVAWVFHLTEDIHQPLHTVALFDSSQHFPGGDLGGNNTYIRLKPGAKPVNLHSYWDGLVAGTFRSIPGNAKTLVSEKKYQPSKLPELKKDVSLEKWIKNEGLPLSKKVVYKNGAIHGIQENPTQVDEAYTRAAKELGEKRVVLSGIRLARALVEIYS